MNQIPEFLFGLVRSADIRLKGSSEMLTVCRGIAPDTLWEEGSAGEGLGMLRAQGSSYPSEGSWPVRLCEHARGKDRSPSALCPEAPVDDAG